MKLPRRDKALAACINFAKRLMETYTIDEAAKLSSNYYEQDYLEVKNILEGEKND